MPSPFPGMDPYLEAPAGWQEFHHLFIAGIQEALVPKVRPRYAVHIERYVYLTALDAEAPRLRPDVSVAQTSPEAPRTEGLGDVVGTKAEGEDSGSIPQDVVSRFHDSADLRL